MKPFFALKSAGPWLGLAGVLAFAMETGGGASSPDREVVEIASFKPRAGVSFDEVLAARRGLEVFLRTAPGYVSSKFLRDADGVCTDLVVWRDEASARAAMRAANDHPRAAVYFALIDDSTISMRHAEVVASFAP